MRNLWHKGPAESFSYLFCISEYGQMHLRVYAVDVRADEEPVDQKKYLEESCKPKCVKPLLEYEACVKRIRGDETGHKHCTGQYFDYWSCVDKCVSKYFMAFRLRQSFSQN
ncbi:Ubiquinol-cytochrome c reductase complex 7.8 kDa protein, putative [Ricinus communis]|uniref:Complex III subunit VI n=1 Tax=Ricinus communis TaxID=3988 RepID=B9T2H1_RICCO|nr:Ubiquinol-cytochrome c reductase complex 7.8 kDa protein, putative [Ricinus communis]